MALILTFLGKGGTGRTTVAIAAAKRLSSQGRRVLLVNQDPGPGLGLLLNVELGCDPQEIASNLQVVQLQTATMLERSWDEVKGIEAQYLRTPVLKAVYGQELGVLPGMDSALALNALREYDASDRYDVIIYDGPGDQTTLRMFGMPEMASWYIRRFRQVFADSDVGRALSPFIQPVSSAILNVNLLGDTFAQPTQQANNILNEGIEAIANPSRVAAYLVTTGDPAAIATARYLWGSAQQIGLTVGGILINESVIADSIAAQFAPSLEKLFEAYDPKASIAELVGQTFAPLPVTSLPARADGNWEGLMAAMPDFSQASQAPRPVTIDVAERKVHLFLPGFDKKQVKLTQYGPEVTIEAGDQRRNIALPPALSGRQVTGAKFQNGYLTISF